MPRFINQEYACNVLENLARRKLNQQEQVIKNSQTFRGLCSTAINLARANPYTTAAIVGVTLILVAFMAYYYQAQQKRIQELEERAQNISTRSLPVGLPLNNNEVNVQTEGSNNEETRNLIRNPRDNDGSANREAVGEAVKKYIDQIINKATNKVVLDPVQKALANSEAKNKELAQELKGYKIKNQDLKRVVETQKPFFDNQVKQLELENNRLHETNQILEGERDSLKETNQIIHNILEEKKAHNIQLTESMLMAQEDVSFRIILNKELVKQLESVNAELIQLQNEKTESEAVRQELALKLQENEKLTVELQSAKSDSEKARQELENLQAQVQQLTEELGSLNGELIKLQSEKSELETENQEQIQEIERARAELNKANQDLQSQIQENGKLTEELQTQLNNKATEVDEITERLNKANQQLQTQIQENGKLTQQLQSEKSESEVAKQQLENQLQESEDHAKAKEEAFAVERQELQTQVKQLTEELNTSNKEIIKSNEENVQLANEKTDIEQKFAEERKSFEDNISNLRILNKKLIERFNENKQQLENKIQENGNLIEEMRTQAEANEEKTRQLEEQLKEAEELAKQQTKELTELQNTIAEFNQETDKLQNELIQKESEINAVKEKKQELQAQIAQKEAAVNEAMLQLENGKRDLQSQIQENGKLTQQLQSEKAESEKARQVLEAQVNKNEELAQQLQAQIAQKEAAVNEAMLQLENGKRDLQSQIQENGKLTQQLQSEKSESEVAKQQLENLQAQVQQLTQQVETVNVELIQKENEVSEVNEEREELRTQVKELTEELKTLNEEMTQLRSEKSANEVAKQEQIQEIERARAELNKANQDLQSQVQENGKLTQQLGTQADVNEEKTKELQAKIEELNQQLRHSIVKNSVDLSIRAGKFSKKLQGASIATTSTEVVENQFTKPRIINTKTEGFLIENKVLQAKIEELTQHLNQKEEAFKKEKDRLTQEIKIQSGEIEELRNKLNNTTSSEAWSQNTTSRSVLEAPSNDHDSEPPTVVKQKKNYTKKQQSSPYSHKVLDTRIKSEGRNFRKKGYRSESEAVPYSSMRDIKNYGFKPFLRFVFNNSMDNFSKAKEISALKNKISMLQEEIKDSNKNAKHSVIKSSASGSDYETFSDDESVESRESNTENNTMNLLKQIVKQNTDDVSNTEETQNFVDCNNSHKQVDENMETPTRDGNGTRVGAPTKLSNNLENDASNPQCERINNLVPPREISKRRTKIRAVTPRKSKDGSNAELSVMQQNLQAIKKDYEYTANLITKNIDKYENILNSKKSSEYHKDRANFYLMHLNVLKGIAPFFEITAQTEDKYLYMIDFCIGAYKGISKELETMKAAGNSHIRFAKHRVLLHLKVTMNTYLKYRIFSTTFTEDMLKEMIKVVEVKIKACENKGKNTNGPDLQGFCNTLVDGLETSAGVTGDNKGDITRLVTENNLSDCGNNELNNNSALVNNEITSNTKVQNNPSTNNNKLGKTGLNANGNNIKTVAEVLKANQYLNKVKKSTNHNNCTDSKKNSDVQSVKKNTDNNQENNNPSPLLLLNSSNIGGTTRFTSNGKSTYTTLVGAGRSVNGIWR